MRTRLERAWRRDRNRWRGNEPSQSLRPANPPLQRHKTLSGGRVHKLVRLRPSISSRRDVNVRLSTRYGATVSVPPGACRALLPVTKYNVFAAATAFVDWARPWIFFDTVIANPAPTASDRVDIEKIWLEACGSSRWQRTDLNQGCAIADHALTVAFPWLCAPPPVSRCSDSTGGTCTTSSAINGSRVSTSASTRN